jgi:uncharacterized protein YggT (Ycf19 family)
VEPEDRRLAREEPGQMERAYDRGRSPAEPPVTAPDTEVVTRFSPARRAYELTYIFFAFICTLILLRIVLKVLAANPAVAFTSFVYGVSDFFLAPFRGLLPVFTSGRTVFEPSALIALLVYAAVGILLARLVAVIFQRDVTVAQHGTGGRHTTY